MLPKLLLSTGLFGSKSFQELLTSLDTTEAILSLPDLQLVFVASGRRLWEAKEYAKKYLQ